MKRIVQEITGVLTGTKYATMADVQASNELVLGNLRHIIETVDAMKQTLRNAPDNAFYCYYGASNIALIVGEMEAKFKACKTSDEYQTLTKDSLEVLPAIADVAGTINDANPSAEQIKSILVKNEQLLEVTMTTGFFDVIRRNVKSIDRKSLRGNFSELLDYIDAKPDEEFRIKKSQS